MSGHRKRGGLFFNGLVDNDAEVRTDLDVLDDVVTLRSEGSPSSLEAKNAESTFDSIIKSSDRLKHFIDESGCYHAQNKSNAKDICTITPDNIATFNMPEGKEFLNKYIEEHKKYSIIVEMCDISTATNLLKEFKDLGKIEFTKDAIQHMISKSKTDDDKTFINSLVIHLPIDPHADHKKAKL